MSLTVRVVLLVTMRPSLRPPPVPLSTHGVAISTRGKSRRAATQNRPIQRPPQCAPVVVRGREGGRTFEGAFGRPTTSRSISLDDDDTFPAKARAGGTSSTTTTTKSAEVEELHQGASLSPSKRRSNGLQDDTKKTMALSWRYTCIALALHSRVKQNVRTTPLHCAALRLHDVTSTVRHRGRGAAR